MINNLTALDIAQQNESWYGLGVSLEMLIKCDTFRWILSSCIVAYCIVKYSVTVPIHILIYAQDQTQRLAGPAMQRNTFLATVLSSWSAWSGMKDGERRPRSPVAVKMRPSCNHIWTSFYLGLWPESFSPYKIIINVEISPLIPESWRAGFIVFRHTSCSAGVEVVASAPEPREQGTMLEKIKERNYSPPVLPAVFFLTLEGGIPWNTFIPVQRTTACPQWPRGGKAVEVYSKVLRRVG